MKALLFAIVLLLSVPAFTVNAQDTDGERIARLEETVYNHLATKADLEKARSDILLATKADIINLRAELRSDIDTLRNELEAKIDDLEKSINFNNYATWIIFVVVTIFGGKARQLLRLEPVQE